MNTYEHEQFGRVRVIIEDGEPWFCSRDVTNALGYRSSHVANYYTHDVERRQLDIPYAYGRMCSLAFISVRGLERICTGTTKPNGEELLEWLMIVTQQKTAQYTDPSDEDTPFSRFEAICELYLNGSEETQTAILGVLDDDEKKSFLVGCGFYKLMTDGSFYRSVQTALSEVVE